MGKCGQINIPTVDNSEMECDMFISSTCVKVKGTEMDTHVSPSLTDYGGGLAKTFKEWFRATEKLKQDNNNIKQEMLAVKSEVKMLKAKIANMKK